MRASGDQSGLRASDAERDEAIVELRDRFAEGRLSQETFLYRMDAALRAKDRAELSDLFADLPDDGQGWYGARLSARDRLARRWHAAADRLSVGRRRQYWPPLPAATPRNAVSVGPSGSAGPGYPGAGYAVDAQPEPQSLCLPRQADRRFTIGRAPSCDFTVPDLSVSRSHARLHKEDDSWLLSDLGSTNGTRLNGWRVTSAVPVQPGDKVSFGSATYIIIDRPLTDAPPDGPA
jgi:hypothetical protein